jgi:hypothetical protein
MFARGETLPDRAQPGADGRTDIQRANRITPSPRPEGVGPCLRTGFPARVTLAWLSGVQEDRNRWWPGFRRWSARETQAP